MFARRIFVVFVASALILPAVLGCIVAEAAEGQSMRCCAAEMSCPRHQKQACISTTVPSGNVQSTPPARVSLAAPSLSVNTYPPCENPSVAFFSSSRVGGAAEYSPPELYALHSALLI
jgi:hypothetical protein